jgi:hypothetical protein
MLLIFRKKVEITGLTNFYKDPAKLPSSDRYRNVFLKIRTYEFLITNLVLFVQVARYFLSSLMLANCMNVEILGGEEESSSSGLEMDTMRLKFLSEKRHHEELEEFQAASQQRDPSIGSCSVPDP